MKSKLNRLFNRMLANKGYTIDQTILIVAIIAILITLVIVTVGWQLINRSSGTKGAAQLKQIEDANGQFFSDQRIWPYQAKATGNDSSTSMQALVNTIATTDLATNIDKTRLKNFLPGYKVNGTVVNHNFGSGGVVTQFANKFLVAQNVGTDTRMVINFTNVPLADAKEMDRSIDGVEDYKTGRVVYYPSTTASCLNATAGGNITTPPGAAPSTAAVTICYAANAAQ